MGDDLWHYVTDPLPAERLLFAKRVPTIGGRSALAVGHTLAVLFGFDRSGFGEAVVDGCGMPLRDDPSAGTADKSAAVPRGDLVVKFAIAPP